jgi:hypothetical protein
MHNVLLLSLALVFSSVSALRIGVLGQHDPSAWGANCTSSDRAFTACNLSLFGVAAATASLQSVDLLLFPEGYALARLYKGAVFEPLVAAVGSTPCASPGNATQQAALSCAASRYRMVIAANVFVTLMNGTQRIAEIVFDGAGVVLGVYFKHHLFPNEEAAGVGPGPFDPTVFTALGRTWGVIICYEGVYPFLTNDFSQMDALVAAGATSFLWSVGGEAPLDALSELLAKKYRVEVGASMDSSITPSSGAIVNASGAPFPYADTRLAVGGGYTGGALLRTAVV